MSENFILLYKYLRSNYIQLNSLFTVCLAKVNLTLECENKCKENCKIGLSIKKSASSQKLKCHENRTNGSKIDKKYLLIKIPFKHIKNKIKQCRIDISLFSLP